MSLTTTAKKFRVGVKVLAVVMVVYYAAILFVIPQARDFLLNLFVDRNPPNPKYGMLDPLKFAPVSIKESRPVISLNTKDGRLPAGLPKKMTVYKFKGIQYSYLSGQRAQTDASKLGFTEQELVSDLKGKEYKWRSLISGGILTINTETRAILLATNMQGKEPEYITGNIDYESAKDDAINILNALGRFDSKKYTREKIKVALGQYTGNSLTQTQAAIDAQFARVDLFGQVDSYPIFGPDPNKGNIWLVLRSPIKDSPYNYPFIEGYFWDLANEKDASYPIISVAEAWKQIQAGKGIISSVVPKNSNIFGLIPPINIERILVEQIYLAYYETPEFQKYLQPIYVFQGKYNTTGTEGGDIVLYYPALTAEFTNKTPTTPQSTTSAPSR